MKLLLGVLLITFSFSVSAEMYKCEVGNKKVYQSFPCDDGGDIIKEAVKPRVEDVAAAKHRIYVYKEKKRQQKISAEIERQEKKERKAKQAKERKEQYEKRELTNMLSKHEKEIKKLKRDASFPGFVNVPGHGTLPVF